MANKYIYVEDGEPLITYPLGGKVSITLPVPAAGIRCYDSQPATVPGSTIILVSIPTELLVAAGAGQWDIKFLDVASGIQLVKSLTVPFQALSL